MYHSFLSNCETFNTNQSVSRQKMSDGDIICKSLINNIATSAAFRDCVLALRHAQFGHSAEIGLVIVTGNYGVFTLKYFESLKFKQLTDNRVNPFVFGRIGV